MNQLLPIIRRVRRPLIGEHKPAVAVRDVEPVKLSGADATWSNTTGQKDLTHGGQSAVANPIPDPALEEAV